MLHWFSFAAASKVWRVFLVDRRETDVLDGAKRGQVNIGMTYYEQRTIYLDAAEPRDVQDYIALHEILHAALDGARLPPWLEERVVRKLSPRLLPVLRLFGFRLPRRPAGASQLERNARRP
jgi:hypothetical protein